MYQVWGNKCFTWLFLLNLHNIGRSYCNPCFIDKKMDG